MQTNRENTAVMRHEDDRLDELTQKRGINRRQLLGAGAGAGMAAALLGGLPAGVMGKAVTAQDGGTEMHTAWPYQVPPAGHFNMFVTDAIMQVPNIYGDLMLLPLGLYYWGSNEWLSILAESWSFIQTGAGAAATPGASPAASPVASPAASPVAGGGAADTFQVKLRQGVVWSDGTEFNAEDVVATHQILRLQQNVVWDYLSAVEMVDPYTVNFVMSNASNVVERYVLRHSPRPRSVYGEWATRAEEFFASGRTVEDPEIVRLNEELNQFRPEGVVANGPYILDPASITSAQCTLNKNPTGYGADQAGFDRLVNFNGETDTISAVVLAQEIDYATQGFAPATEQQMLQSGIRVLRPPVYSGPAIFINYATLGNVFGDKRVRQAIAHAVDRTQNGIVSLADSGIGVEYMSGMSDNLVPDWIDPAVAETLNKYEFNQEGAAALLTEVGWTKNGDRWQTPDGQPVSVELKFPTEFADWSAAGQDFAQQMTDFGIEVIPRAITFTQAEDDANSGDFQLCIRGWGSSNNPHPHFAYVSDLFTFNKRGQDATPGMSYPLVQQTDVAGEVDLDALTVQSAVGLDPEPQIATLTTLAQVFNELLPIIPLFERYGNNAALEGVRVAAWPADDDPILANSPYADGIPTMLLLTGGLQPVGS